MATMGIFLGAMAGIAALGWIASRVTGARAYYTDDAARFVLPTRAAA
jgi:hypothetical protein